MLDIFTFVGLIDCSVVYFIMQGVPSPAADPENDRNRRNARRRNAVKNLRVAAVTDVGGLRIFLKWISVIMCFSQELKRIGIKRESTISVTGGSPLLLATLNRSVTVGVF